MRSKKDMTANTVDIKIETQKYLMQINWKIQLKWAGSQKTMTNVRQNL